MGFWIVWLAIGIGVVLLAAVFLLPKLMFRTYAATLPVRDRTVERVAGEFGTELMCEPSPEVRKYIASYRVARDANGMYFVGRLSRKTAFLQYEIVVYNAANDIVNILRVKEKFNDGETTHVTRLPKNTDFVSVRLVCADDTPMRAERKAFNARFAVRLALLCASFALAAVLLLWLGLTAALRFMDGFTASLDLPLALWAEILGFTALGVAGLVCILALAHFFLLRRRGDHDR